MGNTSKEVYARYKKANYKDFTLHLNKNTEDDIIQKLDSVPNKQGYVKGLIRDDISKDKGDGASDS